MTYSITSGLALILNLIINREMLKNTKSRFGERKEEQRAAERYCFFIMFSNIFFVVDFAWGILYEHHGNQSLFPLIYLVCVLYFVCMFLSMLAWIRYIVAYLNKKRFRSNLILGAAWLMFAFAIFYLGANVWKPLFFSFSEQGEYIPESGRYVAFLLQIAVYVVTAGYMFYIAHKSIGEERVRYIAVGSTCVLIELFLFLQLFDSDKPFYAMGLIIGICMMHSYVELGEKKEKSVYDSIAKGLAEDYAAMYYIDTETGEYKEYVASEEYKSMNVPVKGLDFYKETQENIDAYVYPDDRELARTLHTKEKMLENLEGRKSYSYKYRLMVNGEPRIFLFTIKLTNDGKNIVLYEKDIEEDIRAEIQRKENQKKQVTFSQIAESLAVNYDLIYYVDAVNADYVSFECRNIYGQLDMKKSGDDFFEDCKNDILHIVHKSDCDLVMNFLNRKNLERTLDVHKSSSLDYRVMAGNDAYYVRLTVRKTSDDSHYIIGIENVDDEIQKEKQYLKELNTEKELARRDELTGLKNKNAYHELVESVQNNIDNGLDYLTFALVVCDANNLKIINDTEGHVAGDEYLKSSAKLLRDIFVNSPVFRVGGDEFVVFLRSDDFTNRESLMKKLRNRVLENIKTGARPILATGMAEYIPGRDGLVSDIFDRADKEMYENKQSLKENRSL